jgi:hypothetical protein
MIILQTQTDFVASGSIKTGAIKTADPLLIAGKTVS